MVNGERIHRSAGKESEGITRAKVEDIIEHTLNTLEKGNFVKVKTCQKSGEKELIPLDKVI